VAPLAFYFDFISPYAYLAWTQIRPLAARHGRTVEPAPVLFAALLDANGQKGPAEIPNKRLYTWKDCARTARRLGVPLAAPATHPFNPLLALRAASSPGLAPDVRAALIDGLFAATWADGRDVSAPAVVADVARRAGADGDGVVAETRSLEAKERVRARTAEALALGAFGVPTIIADGELFWGLDSFANLDAFLAGDRADTGVGAWANVKASASRKGA
jgi:2-hydroxychromene-2-carboxylate isomerase